MNKNFLPHIIFFLFILNIISADPSSGQWKQFVYTDGLSSNYIFDVEMFTHINTIEATSFTTGEILTGVTSGATAVVQSISTTKSIKSLLMR